MGAVWEGSSRRLGRLWGHWYVGGVGCGAKLGGIWGLVVGWVRVGVRGSGEVWAARGHVPTLTFKPLYPV